MKIITFYNRLFCRKEIRNFLDDLVSDKLVSYLEYRGWFTSYFEVYCDEGSEFNNKQFKKL